jgi:ABC-type taurine transport system ATPase subunit
MVFVDRLDVSAVGDYWPRDLLNEGVVSWLESGLLSGQLEEGSLQIHGDMDYWPFENGEGRFEAIAKVQNADIHYFEGWPLPMMNIEQNFGLGNHVRFSAWGVLKGGARRAAVEAYVRDMSIRPAATRTLMRNLSGGNQQKVVIAPWLATGAQVLLFDEPTRGIDVGAKSEIYALLRRLAADGAAVVFVSSELPELLLLADRIGIVANGRLTRIVRNDADLTEERLMNITSTDSAHVH